MPTSHGCRQQSAAPVAPDAIYGDHLAGSEPQSITGPGALPTPAGMKPGEDCNLIPGRRAALTDHGAELEPNDPATYWYPVGSQISSSNHHLSGQRGTNRIGAMIWIRPLLTGNRGGLQDHGGDGAANGNGDRSIQITTSNMSICSLLAGRSDSMPSILAKSTDSDQEG